MTPQPRARTRRAAVGLLVLAAAGTITLAGCDPRTLAYFFGDGAPQIPGQAPKMDGKKIVVLVTAAPAATTDFQSIDRDINRELVTVFRDRIKKVEIVDTQKVRDWVAAHPTWTDAGEIAKAFEADFVVFFEIQNFSIRDPRSPQMLEGNAEVNFRVTEYAHPTDDKGKPKKDAPKETNQVYEDSYKSTFPRNAPVAVDTGINPLSFKVKFVKLVARELSEYFLGRNPGDDIAPDQRF